MKWTIKKNFSLSLLWLASSCALLCALITYNPYDPSLINVTDESTISNWLGAFGAQVSALLRYFFGGVASLVIPLLLLRISFLTLKSQSLKEEWDQLVCCIVSMFMLSCLTAYYALDLRGSAPGGYIGQCFRYIIRTHPHGHVLLWSVHVILWASFVIVTRLSFLPLARILVRMRWIDLIKKFFALCVLAYCWIHKNVQRCIKNVMWSKETEEEISPDDLIWSALEELERPIDDTHILHDPFWSTFGQHNHKNTESSNPSSSIGCDKQANNDTRKNVRTSTERAVEKIYRVPPISLLSDNQKKNHQNYDEELKARARIVEEKLGHFGVTGSVVSITPGPVVTLFEFQPDINIRVSRILALEDDLALALKALSLRIIAPIPGKSVVGFEVANEVREILYLAPLINSQAFKKHAGHVPIVLGYDTIGTPIIVDIVGAPHMLLAGSTGAGKSVALNGMLTSMLYKRTPEELRLLLIDPKRLEFAAYSDIPHLICPIITHPSQAVTALKWVVKTMEERYEYMASLGVKNISDYKQWCKEQHETDAMPFIVVVIDELADLMLIAGGDLEDLLARIAHMARAAGIHLIVATQRPSVDVLTGVIKVNFPSRIAFKVASKIDSRTILDVAGAEKLLGKGDMLYLAPDGSLSRLHGAYISSQEVTRVVQYVKTEAPVNYLINLEQLSVQHQQTPQDPLYNDVVSYVKTLDEISISQLQRVFNIGYNRSARIIEMLEHDNIVTPPSGSKMRKVIR